MRVLALDIGQKRIGLAVSSYDMRIAQPLKVLPAHEVINGARSFMDILEDYEPEILLVGLPYTLSGEEGPQAHAVKHAAELIAQKSKLPVEFIDERLSSSQAQKILAHAGLSQKDMRGKVDMIAASVFLQAYLDNVCARQESKD